MNLYRTEVNAFLFPHNEEAIWTLAAFRGATASAQAGEGFMLLRELM